MKYESIYLTSILTSIWIGRANDAAVEDVVLVDGVALVRLLTLSQRYDGQLNICRRLPLLCTMSDPMKQVSRKSQLQRN